MSPLLQHLKRYAGTFAGCVPAFQGNAFRRYFRAYFEMPDRDLVTVISSGIRMVGNDPIEEVACSLLAAQATEASYLVDAVCEMIIARQRGIEVDCLVDNGGAFFEDSLIEGLLASANPYFDTRFNIHATHTGRVILQVITLLPVTRDEIDLIEELDTDALYDMWERDKTDLRDVYRRSPVHQAT